LRARQSGKTHKDEDATMRKTKGRNLSKPEFLFPQDKKLGSNKEYTD